MPTRSSSALAVLGISALVLAIGTSARAQESTAPTESPAAEASDSVTSPTTYDYRPLVDIPVSLLSAAIVVGADGMDDETEGPTIRSVDSVFVLDRFVARSPERRQPARTASDVVLIASVGLGALASSFSLSDAHEAGSARRRERARRFGIYVESLALTNALTTVVKLGARRPRPFTYAAGYDPTEGRLDDQLSFFSGHASTVASASATAIYFAFAEAGADGRRFAVLGAGTVATLSVATLRVRAAKHFPTDVTVGVIVGSCVGVLVPHLHRRTGLSVSAEPVAGGAIVGISGLL